MLLQHCCVSDGTEGEQPLLLPTLSYESHSWAHLTAVVAAGDAGTSGVGWGVLQWP